LLLLQSHDDLDELRRTPEGATRIIAQSLLPVIAVTAPEAIIINCVMMPDTTLLKQILSAYIPERHLPKLIKVTHLKQYMTLGTLAATVIAETHQS